MEKTFYGKLAATFKYLFKVEPKPDFIFTPPEHSFLCWLHDALLLTEKKKRSKRITQKGT